MEARKKIAQDYLNYLDRKEIDGNVPLSRWQNFLYGQYYNGQYASSPEHRNYIALIDLIAKLDPNSADFFRKIIISDKEIEEQLLNHLFDYFISLQNSLAQKNEVYYRNMEILKLAIHYFARRCNIQKRIIKYNLPSGVFIKKKEDQQYKYLIEDEYHFDHEKDALEDDQRKMEARWGKISKIMGLGMGITEVFMALGSLAVIHLVAPLGILIALKIIVAISASFFGYFFAKDDLFELSKQIFLNQLFKVKNPLTGDHEPLKRYQKVALVVLSPFALVAGTCVSSLAFTSVAKAGTACILPVLSSVLAGFVFLLITATFFLVIKGVVSRVTKEKLLEYINTLKKQEQETRAWYGARLLLEIGKWAVAFLTMSLVAVGGYYLFKDKAIMMLEKIWTALSVVTIEKIASIISFCYSAIKLVFGVNKIMYLLEAVRNLVRHAFSSTTIAAPELNLIQQEERFRRISSTGIAMALLVPRAIASAGYYYEAGKSHPFTGSEGVGPASGVYIGGINAVAFSSSQEIDIVTPLPSTKPVKVR